MHKGAVTGDSRRLPAACFPTVHYSLSPLPHPIHSVSRGAQTTFPSRVDFYFLLNSVSSFRPLLYRAQRQRSCTMRARLGAMPWVGCSGVSRCLCSARSPTMATRASIAQKSSFRKYSQGAAAVQAQPHAANQEYIHHRDSNRLSGNRVQSIPASPSPRDPVTGKDLVHKILLHHQADVICKFTLFSGSLHQGYPNSNGKV